jgi:hypothetical protein
VALAAGLRHLETSVQVIAVGMKREQMLETAGNLRQRASEGPGKPLVVLETGERLNPEEVASTWESAGEAEARGAQEAARLNKISVRAYHRRNIFMTLGFIALIA